MMLLCALGIPVLWAITVLCARFASLALDPFWANVLRFLIMAVLLLPVVAVSGRQQRSFYKNTFVASVFLYACLILVNLALVQSTVAKTTFYGAFYCFLIPLIKVLGGHRYHYKIVFVMLLALIGGLALADFQVAGFGLGELFALGGAVFYALYVLYLDKLAKNVSLWLFMAWQSLFMFFLSVAAWLVYEMFQPKFVVAQPSVVDVAALALLAVLSIAAYALQMWVQRSLSAATMGFVVTLDAPIASILAFALLGQSLTLVGWIGAAVCLVAVMLVPRFVQARN